MKFRQLELADSYIMIPDNHKDDRGEFNRIFCKSAFEEIGIKKDIVQIDHSITYRKGTLRGMHYQIPPKTEIKIIKCIKGKVYDVIVDLRRNSRTFLKWISNELSVENMNILIVPEGFAHGFQSLEPDTHLLYMHTEMYSPEFESGLLYNDKILDISWPLPVASISKRDISFLPLDPNFKGVYK